MSNTVSVTIPFDLRQKAGKLGINISEVARKALADAVTKSEKEAREIRQDTPRTAAPCDGGAP